jgi:aspartate aminotransferase
MHGALIVAAILSSPVLYSEWLEEMKAMSNRIRSMRQALVDALSLLKTPGPWNHITDQIGMFSFTGLTPEQCAILTNKHHVYLLSSGRISMAGLNNSNIQRLAAAINDAVRSTNSKM